MEQTNIQEAVAKFKRDEDGFLPSVEYKFNEDGSIDWRQMVPKQYLFPNKDFFTRNGKEIPSSVDGLKDHELCIKLGGIRYLAKIRGFNSVKFNPINIKDGYVISSCEINWVPNYENPTGVVYQESANATDNNCHSFTTKFLETIANNRAFIRAVRGFLNINIVGEDELDKSEKQAAAEPTVDKNSSLSPAKKIQSILEKAGEPTDFESFKERLREFWRTETYRNEDVPNWVDFSDIPAKEARKLIAILNQTGQAKSE